MIVTPEEAVKTKVDVEKLASAKGTGRAVLLGVDLDDEDGGVMHEGFSERGSCSDPIASCHALRESIEDDFPTHTFTVVANERARYLTWRVRMVGLLGAGSYSPADFAAAQG